MPDIADQCASCGSSLDHVVSGGTMYVVCGCTGDNALAIGDVEYCHNKWVVHDGE